MGPEQQDRAGIPTCEASFLLPLLGAYGVSCRARVSIYATPHLVAIRPRSLSAALGPPLLPPLGVEDSARTGGNLTDPAARCVSVGGVQGFLPTRAAAPRRGR